MTAGARRHPEAREEISRSTSSSAADPALSVVLANVTRSHSFHTALALHRAGRLRRFVTSTYAKPRSVRTHLYGTILSHSPDSSNAYRLSNRRIEGLPDEKVVSITWPEVAEQLWHRAPPLHRFLTSDAATLLKMHAFDRQVAAFHVRRCDILHAFEGCGEHSMRHARRQRIVNVLDAPVIEKGLWARLEAREHAEVGLPEPTPSALQRGHLVRMNREVEMADYLFVGLDFVRRSFSTAGFPDDRIFVAPYGVDTHTAFPYQQRLGRDTFNILLVGQLSWYKGLRLLLDALEQLEVPNAKLTVVGPAIGEWRGYFERRFGALNIPVQHLSGIPQGLMPQIFADADVFVFPSLVGGIGLATYQAMSTGLPVITSDGDVVIRDGVDGFVRDPYDPHAWAATLTTLHEDRELRRRLGDAAAARAREFTWDRYYEKVAAAYEEIESRHAR